MAEDIDKSLGDCIFLAFFCHFCHPVIIFTWPFRSFDHSLYIHWLIFRERDIYYLRNLDPFKKINDLIQ